MIEDLEDEIGDGWSIFISKKKIYKTYALPSVSEESFMKVEPARWGSYDDIDMSDHDDKG